MAMRKRAPRPKRYRLIADDLESKIDSGELPPASQIPTEEELAAEYVVARSTVRRALRELRQRGLVWVDHPKGTFVVDRKPTVSAPIAPDRRWIIRMPSREEIARLGLRKEGEPVIEFCYPRSHVEVVGTAHKVFGWGPLPDEDLLPSEAG